MCLAGIFKQQQMELLRNLGNRVHVGHLAEQMNGKHGGNRPTGPAAQTQPGVGVARAALKMRAQLHRAHVVRLLVHLNELGNGTRLGNGLGRGNERVRHRKHRIARLHSARNQCETQRVGSAGHAHAFARLR